jgi:WD40 repeat protein
VIVEAPPRPRIAVPQTPYVGLTPFTENDAPFFFGREKERRIIAANLLASRLTLLYGASGVGKSSIIRAGIQRDFRTRAEKVLASGRFPESIVVVFTGWRDDPIVGLAECVASSVRELLGKLAPRPPSSKLGFDDLLVEWNRRLDEKALQHGGATADLDEPIRTELLIILDQFEQYFVYHADEDGPGTFAIEFPRAVNRDDLRASFLISLREDAYTQLDRFEGRILNLFASNLRIEHLDETAATAAIVKPVEKYNELLGNDDARYEVEPELVEAVIRDVRAGNIVLGQAGGGGVVVEHPEPEQTRVETPFLQLVMSRLWEEEQRRHSHVLRLETLRNLGGAERIVRRHLDDAMSALDDDERAVAARMFHQLVTPSGARIVHSARDLAGYSDVSVEVAEPILEKLDERRILRTIDAAPGEKTPRFEIRHDVLAGAIVEWNRQYEEARRREDDEIRQRAQLEEERRRQRARIFFGFGIAAFALFLIAVSLGGFAWTQRNDAQAQRRKASSRELAIRALLSDDPDRSLQLALQARHTAVTDEAVGALRDALVRAPRVDLRSPLRSENVAFSRDGKLIFLAGENGIAQIWDWARKRPLETFRQADQVLAAFSPDRTLVLATTRIDKTARIEDARTRKTIVVLRGHTGTVLSAGFSADGRRVLTASSDGTARVWDAHSGESLAVLGKPAGTTRTGAGGVESAVFSPDGTLVATAGPGNTVRVWSWATNRIVAELRTADAVSTVAFSRDGTRVVTTGVDLGAQVWDLASEKRLALFRGQITSAAFSPDGKLVVTGGTDNAARVWIVATQRSLIAFHRAPGSTDSITSVAFSPDGRLIASASSFGEVAVWTAPERSSLVYLRGHGGPVYGAGFSPDGREIVTGAADGTTRIWSRAGRSIGRRQTGAPVLAATYSPDGKLLLTGGADGQVRLRNDNLRLLRVFRKYSDAPVLAVEFSPDGKRFLTAAADGMTRILELATGTALLSLGRGGGSVNGAAFSPDGNRVVTASANGVARLWDLRSGKVTTLEGPAGSTLNGAAFSPDGKLVVTASSDGTAVIWDARTAKQLVALRGHTESVNSAVFSSKGKLVLTASSDGTARVWDAVTGVTLAVLYGDGSQLYRAVFSADDSAVVTAGADGTARVYVCDVCAAVPEAPEGAWPPIGS